MTGYLPCYYQSSRVMRSIVQGQGSELDKLRQALDETLDQFFVNTATCRLGDWEAELGLPVAPAQPETERRDKIMSKLRGMGTCTIKLVKQVAESYDAGAVNVAEDFTGYLVIVKFVDTRGLPPNIEDLMAAVRDIVPAHLEILYEYSYFLWDDLDEKVWTWDQLDTLGLMWDQLEVYV
ncbi:putative phage tail protein [Pelotomaculum propionicicum]|uniref:putative phage tail protein n=1 Tax=Pelotomaculum propionicicum TaxID=258475 RepID=UPI003B769F70